MHTSYDDITRRFLMTEGDVYDLGVFARIQAIQDLLSKISPKSQQDARRIEMIDDNLKALRRLVRNLVPSQRTDSETESTGG